MGGGAGYKYPANDPMGAIVKVVERGSLRATAIQSRPAKLGYKNPEKNLMRDRSAREDLPRWMDGWTYETHDHAQRQDPRVLPPHATPHRPGASPERRCLTSHGVRLIYEQLDAFSSG